MNFNSPKTEPNKSFKKFDPDKVEKTEIPSKPDQKPNDKPKNKIERPKIDIQKEPKNKIQREKIDLHTPARNKIERPKIDIYAPTRNKIEPRKIDPKKEPKHKLLPRIIDPKAPPRHKIEPRHINPKMEPKHKILPQQIENQSLNSNKLNINRTPSIQNINKDTLNLERIKEEVKNLNWTHISDDWNITTRSNQYADYKKIPLDPAKEVSKENPLYRHKEWLKNIYNNKNWRLSDKDIANLCGVHPSVIGKWRNKHHISRKLQGEGKWTDRRSGRVYIRVPQDYNHPELTKTSGSTYRLEHIYNIEKYLSQHPELELSKKYLVKGKYLKVGTRVKYVNQDSRDNSVKNLRISKNTVVPTKEKDNLKTFKTLNRTTSKNSQKSLQKHPKNNQVKRNVNREVSKKIHAKGYRARMTMPKDYNHPKLTPNSKNRYERLVHIVKMERFLANNPDLELSKKYLIQGKYLRTGIEVHHINQIKTDNRIENLWIYENKKEHARGEQTLYNSLKSLVSTNQIQFKNGKYFLNPDKSTFKTTHGITQKSDPHFNFKNINAVKKEIKKIDWKSISNEWSVQVNKNQFVQKTVKVDPTRDPSKENPLHHHKEWFKRIIIDKRFNLTDSRLAKLCGITRDTARYWRERKHGIKGKTEWGFERRVDESDGRIWIKVPKDYANPVVQKEDHHRRFMLEHRYEIEQHLAKHPELEISKKCLVDGKYLKTEAQVHHINLNYQDNRVENLWVFDTDKNHKEATKSLSNLVEELLKSGKIMFEEGQYLTEI